MAERGQEVVQVRVTLSRVSLQASYGLSIGTTLDGQTIVTKVTPGGVADGKLEPGDTLLSIGDTDVGRLASHNSIVSMLALRQSVELTVARDTAQLAHEVVEDPIRTAAQQLMARARELTGDGLRMTYMKVFFDHLGLVLTVPRRFLSSIPPHTCALLCSAQCPCV